MKDKLMIMALAVVLLVGLVPPGSAMANTTETTADDVKYRDIEDFMHSAGYMDFKKTDGYNYFVYLYNDFYYVVYMPFSDVEPYIFYPINHTYVTSHIAHVVYLFNTDVPYYDKYYCPASAGANNNYSAINTHFSCGTRRKVSFQGVEEYYYLGHFSSSEPFQDVNNLVYSDFNVYLNESSSDFTRDCSNLIFESSVYENYSFPVWCQDAGLNCLASSNESPTKIPYSYNSYWHIVRKTVSGKWLLTTIGSTLGEAKMSLRLSEDLGSLIINEFSGDDSFVISVRQYEYDTDGWKVRTFDTYDFDDLTSGKIVLESGSGIDDYRVLAYSNTDIYTHDGMSVYMSASTEYFEPTVEQPTPPVEGGDGGDSSESGGTGSSGGSIGGGTRGDSYGISVDVISVYEKCWNGSDVLGKLYKGDVVEILEVYDSPSYVNLWYRVNCEIDGVEVEGWINGGIVYDDGETDSGSSGEASGSDADELVEALSGVVDMISVVPLMIGAVFSFLPTWCLVVVGASFSFMCIYLVVKLIRG